MEMGLPGTIADQATFQWRTVATYAKADGASKPYAWDSAPVTSTTHADVLIPVAVDFKPAIRTSYTAVGKVSADKVVLTILDEDFALIQGATHCLLGGNAYEIQYVAPPMGLFDATIFEMYLVALDES